LLLGDTRAAAADIEGAAEAAAQLDDAALRERNVADVNVARAALYSVSDLHRAVSAADAAVDYVRRADPAFTLGKLLMLRGMSRKALGDAAGAEADLVAAIEAFETKRRELISAADRLRAFDYERPAFKQLVRFHSLTGAHAAALRIAERSRTGGWARSSGASAGWLDPIEAHRSLPAEVALVYFETLDDRVLVWVLTRERFVHFSRALDLSTLTRQVARIERAIHRGATLAGLEPLSRELVTQLIAPALAEAGSRSTIVFIPDGPLYSVPFAALPIAGGGPLLAQRTIGVAPSFTIFVQASKRLEALAPDDVLAVGAGHDPRATGLAALPFANGEARAVGDLYPQRTVLTGADATVSRVLAADRAVVHFAGHTVVNREFPLYSRLFLAPASDDPGVLLASRILDHPFNRTRVVVLATCEAGAGTVIKGEGIVSVARAFVAAGVPSVVASLWPVNDDQELFTTFHRELRQRRDAATALREAQLAAFRQGGGVGQVRSWGGLAALGGIAISSR
jgi:CHAT domain-containing protein